jgi:chaperone BCS1
VSPSSKGQQLLCLFISCIVQQATSYFQHSLTEVLYTFIFGPRDDGMTHRSIEIIQRFNQYGKVWDYEQKNHILQKAISLYLSDILDLSNKCCIYELLEKPKKKNSNNDKLNDNEDGSSGSYTDTESCTSNEEVDDSTKQNEVERLDVVTLPPLNTWIIVEGVEFMHEVITPENSGDKKGLTETKVNFCFRSALPDGTTRIDSFIDKAFTIYQENERQKCVQR